MHKTSLLRPSQRYHTLVPTSIVRYISSPSHASVRSSPWQEAGVAVPLALSTKSKGPMMASDCPMIRSYSQTRSLSDTQQIHDPLRRQEHHSRPRKAQRPPRQKSSGLKQKPRQKNQGKRSASPGGNVVTPSPVLEFTTEKVRSSPGFPQQSDYPTKEFPRTVFTDNKQDIENLLGLHCGPPHSMKATIRHRKQTIGTKYTLEMNWPAGYTTESRLKVTGHGKGAKEARTAAWAHALLRIHEVDALDEILPERIMKAASNQEEATLLREEKDSLLDVYDYCAQYTQVPVINREIVKRTRNRRETFRTSISFPLHEIEISILSTQVKMADTFAAIQFKKLAEAYQAKQETTKVASAGSEYVNSVNADKFLDFYKLKNRIKGKTYVDVKDVKHMRGMFEAAVLVGSTPLGLEVQYSDKKTIKKVACLTAALSILDKEPELMAEFLKALKEGNGNILYPVKTMDLAIDDSAVLLMRDTLAKARQYGLGDQYQHLEAESTDVIDFAFESKVPSARSVGLRNKALKESRLRYQESEELANTRKLRASLPMNQYIPEVLNMIEENIYSVLIGETGSGKTTQVPQILLDHYIEQGEGAKCHIICTQPRRIAATSVATRVAGERGERLGETVGYQVRGSNQRATQPGSINYCTTGLLLAQLQTAPDRIMDRVTHIVLDEVHERDKFIDYTMIILKEIISARLRDGKHVPKICLMSATLDPSLFAPYFSTESEDGSPVPAPILKVPGRTFPVAQNYLEGLWSRLETAFPDSFQSYLASDPKTSEYLELERALVSEKGTAADQTSSFSTASVPTQSGGIDWKRKGIFGNDEDTNNHDAAERLFPSRLVSATVAHLAHTTQDGAILVFLPGWEEIVAVQKELMLNPFGVDFSNTSKYTVFTLHSSVGTDQLRVFDPSQPGNRKIILSTNIAETSVTIPDVQYIVDSGKVRETRYDPQRRLSSLVPAWISRSSARQRAGRAGRVQNGYYYAVYSEARFNDLREVGLPELLRTDLAETCLDVVAQQWNTPPREFLAKAIEPPPAKAVDAAMRNLVEIDALTDEEDLTPLGRLLSTLPVHPELGKMIVMGIIFRCLDPMIILGAARESRQLFVQPVTARKEAKASRLKYAAGNFSDHMAILNAFRELRATFRTKGLGAARAYAHENFIHWGAYKSMEATASLIETALMTAKVIPVRPAGAQSDPEYGGKSLNVHARKPEVVKALITAGLYPRVAVKPDHRSFNWRTKSEADIQTFPGSVIYEGRDRETPLDLGSDKVSKSLFAVHDELSVSADGRNLYIKGSTLVSPLTVALFGGKIGTRRQSVKDNLDVSSLGGVSGKIASVDDWLSFYVQSDDRLALRTIIETRKALERMLVLAYADLSKREPLNNNIVRSIFSDGMVQVLGMDSSVFGPGFHNRTQGQTQDSWEKMKQGWEFLDRKENRSKPGSFKWGEAAKPKSSAAKNSEGVSLGMLEWAAKWEAKAKLRAEQKEKADSQKPAGITRRW